MRKIIDYKVPNLSKYQSFEEYLNKLDDMDGNSSACNSDSEFDDESTTVMVDPSQKQTRDGSTKRAVKLTEIGPRMTLELIKVLDGFNDGNILYQKSNSF